MIKKCQYTGGIIVNMDFKRTYLITGSAGFIGFYLSKNLLDKDCKVIGIDNLNDYYDIGLKHARLDELKPYENFTFIQNDISNKVLVHPNVRVLNQYHSNH